MLVRPNNKLTTESVKVIIKIPNLMTYLLNNIKD